MTDTLEAFWQRCDEAAADFPLYVLDDARNVVRGSLQDWVEMKMDFENRCRVGEDMVGDVRISTVFLGMDYNHARVLHPDLPTLCFETAVFRPTRTDIVNRYATWSEAEAGHQAVLEEEKQ